MTARLWGARAARVLAIANFSPVPFNRLIQLARRSFRRGRRNQHARARALSRLPPLRK